jgi:hypothetical protein
LLDWSVFQRVLSWRNLVISIVESDEICVRIAAIFVLIQETSDPIDATYGATLVSVSEIFLSSDETDTKEIHERNCAPTEETFGATRVISGKTVAI